MRITIDISASLRRALHELALAIGGKQTNTFSGGSLMFVVKDDNPDVAYHITAPNATDSEGNAIPNAQFTYEVSSSDANVVSITQDAADPLTGTVHFGAPGQAAVNVNVKAGDVLLGAFGSQFTVTTGDPAAITGGGIAFDGLTDQ